MATEILNHFVIKSIKTKNDQLLASLLFTEMLYHIFKKKIKTSNSKRTQKCSSEKNNSLMLDKNFKINAHIIIILIKWTGWFQVRNWMERDLTTFVLTLLYATDKAMDFRWIFVPSMIKRANQYTFKLKCLVSYWSSNRVK